jgi:putative serine protease XkdF
VAKRDDERQLVFGWAYVSVDKGAQVTDHSGEQVDLEDLETAAYVFNLEFREANDMHVGKATGQLIESFVSTPEKLGAMGLAPDALPHGWWTGFHIEDEDQWAMVKTGERSMFSIEGSARKVAA